MHRQECLRLCPRSTGTGGPRAVNWDVLWRCAIWREWNAALTRTHRSRCTSAGGPMYGLEWTMVATVGPLAFGVLLIYLVIRKG
jgi:hypothetical protein